MPTIQERRELFGRANFLNLGNILYAYNHDYYRRDGFELGVGFELPGVDFLISAGEARHYNQPIIDAPSRVIISADPGNYRTVGLKAEWLKPSFFAELFGGGSPLHGTLSAMYGQETLSETSFARVEASVSATIPTFATGYNPMNLKIDVFGGTRLTDSLPRQYQFSILKRYYGLWHTQEPRNCSDQCLRRNGIRARTC